MIVETLGIDIAKNVFQLHGVNHHGCVVLKRRVMRDQLLDIVALFGPGQQHQDAAEIGVLDGAVLGDFKFGLLPGAGTVRPGKPIASIPARKRELIQRGVDVMLAEGSGEWGGRVARECRLPGLATWGRVRDWRVGQLSTRVNAELYLHSPRRRPGQGQDQAPQALKRTFG